MGEGEAEERSEFHGGKTVECRSTGLEVVRWWTLKGLKASSTKEKHCEVDSHSSSIGDEMREG